MNKLSFIFLSLLSLNAAADSLILDPDKIECRIEPYQEFKRCNVYFDGVQIHWGRRTDFVTANGDLLKCTAVIASAKSEKKSVVLKRGVGNVSHQPLSWGSNHFFAVENSKECSEKLSPFTGNYTGSWSGTAGSDLISTTTLAMTMYQSGDNINGYWIATGGASGLAPLSGQIQGSVADSGSEASITLTVPAGQSYVGSVTGTFTLSNGQLAGSVAGVVNQSQPFNATISLTQSR